MQRFPNWPALLEAFLNASRFRTFQYGSWDCCLFVADAIRAMTGTDIASRFRNRYTSRPGALQAIAEEFERPSIEAVAEGCARAYGMPEIPVLRASRGDMVLIKRGRDFSMGLIAMNGMQIVIVGKNLIGPVPIERACRAWRV